MSTDMAVRIAELIVSRGLTEVPRDSVLPASSLRQDLGFDSLKMVEFVVALEEEFGVMFDDSSLSPEDFTTLDNVCRLVGSLMDNG